MYLVLCLEVYSLTKGCTSCSWTCRYGEANQNISQCSVQLKYKPAYFESWRHMIERCYARYIEMCWCGRKQLMLRIAGRYVSCSLRFTKIFLFVIVQFFFFFFFCPSVSQILEDTLSCLSIQYIKYILKVFKLIFFDYVLHFILFV